MKLVFIRHGDPNYELDTLTEQGEIEATLLNKRIQDWTIKDCYVSPLGRAKKTAEMGLAGKGIQPIECDWLREFHAPITKPNLPDEKSICWDWLPQDWTKEDALFHVDDWLETDVMKAGNVRAEYERVCGELDKILAEHGYKRKGRRYDVIEPNTDTLVFFCHYGVTCVLLSHLMNVSPMILWHGLCLAPTSVSTVASEERREGIAYFRASELGDTSHLYAGGEKPSASARFCECYRNLDERHD